MKYLNTKHERNSAKITALIVLILLLLLFVVGPQYMDPPIEYGVSVNFGNSAVGSGNVQPDKPVKSEDLNINKQPQEEQAQEETQEEAAASTNETSEEVITQESEEAIAIKKQKEAEAKAKAEAERKAKEKAAAEEKKRQEEAKKKAKLDAMMGGLNNSNGESSGSEGDDNQAGDKGQLNGDPYAPSYFGDPGTGSGGVGYGLNGRGKPTKQIYQQDCNEAGLVVVRIEVDQNGNVVKAEPGAKGTKNTAKCLLEPARKIALSHKWKADPNAPIRQVGFVSINFKLGQ
ncbi:energy transducer TonB [Mesoflavibacter sp. SCSIO 43206]|uniref:energy transducer TonB n=1 Tax=Mesoflavibacter sp. SCSIO 43206 TaxID=2779362 RepID=UPI001CA9F4A4|nr:energy transducer TonB [Mesoflavibacter sp. SCSIO 43206]UAB75910.1 energy transducer TonB [Mesoflavibacter sp. SCSIO 43206]